MRLERDNQSGGVNASSPVNGEEPKEWVRVIANLSAGIYDVRAAATTLAPPEWPEQSMEQLVSIAFRGKVINSLDHPIILGLDGRQ